MNLLLAVVEDLSSFAYRAIKGLLLESPRIESADRVIGRSHEYSVLPASTQTGGARELMERTAQVPAVEEVKSIQKSTVMYTSSLVTPLRSAPGVLGDTVYAMLPYGSLVMVLDVQDMWAYVASGVHTGWVYVDDLEDRAAHVYPSFHIGEKNDAEDPATIRLRALLNDEFGAGEMHLSLQPEEYVVYRLKRRGVTIAWPPVRPRTPGTWKDILDEIPGVVCESRPSVGAIIEYRLPQEEGGERRGHLAYVEAVFPDNTIQISEVGWPEEGGYNERVLVAAEWQALQPTFLLFS